MGSRFCFALLGVILCTDLLHAADASPQAKARHLSQKDNAESFLRHEMQMRHIPGLQAVVVRHGKVIFQGAYGVANIENSVPVTPHTVFPVHSITKAFTGVAIMQLVEEGKLDLAAPVSQYLDDLPVAWRPITIRQLLTHTSGIPELVDRTQRLIADGEEAVWAKLRAMPVDFAPGERFEYSATNYALLGRVIDKLSTEPFLQFMKERQLDVVGMPLSGFGDSSDVVPHISGSYWYLENFKGERRPSEKIRNYLMDWPPFIRTTAGLNTTAEELARWIIALQQGRLLKSKASVVTLWTPGLLNDGKTKGFSPLLNGYALGWPTVIRSEHRAVAPTGGGRAALFIYPDDDLAIVVLTNLCLGGSPEQFIDEFAGYYIPDMRVTAGFGLAKETKAFRTELLKRGFGHAQEVLDEARSQNGELHLPEDDLNNWGYGLLQERKIQQAIEIFRVNVGLYPQSANAYDSLAEAYEANGDKSAAIKNYTRSLELNPKNTNAIEQITKLTSSASNHQE